ncbi:hypothetical protein C922_05296 [Plasmodium inui San Antonio 1]|uniref:Uncharacterized protein n=1 Tax=Plasmodium inui San Antonio 1 TaxID=1237626 RepID=W6ZTS6_9APIC|nr:hypothetical protein C922_05296 [Plasmodium inui San Antonio 1]EUD64322.1 hypothetical protein C922_05296 [Plasmodium inui San Antonio 1]
MEGTSVSVIVLYEAYYGMNHVDLFNVPSFEEYYEYYDVDGTPVLEILIFHGCNYLESTIPLIVWLLQEDYCVHSPDVSGFGMYRPLRSEIVRILGLSLSKNDMKGLNFEAQDFSLYSTKDTAVSDW